MPNAVGNRQVRPAAARERRPRWGDARSLDDVGSGVRGGEERVRPDGGQAGVGVIRVSGPLAPLIAKNVLGKLPEPRHAHFGRFRDEDGDVIDEGLVLYFPGPNSFTGEDVVEFQGHGGQVVMECLLRRIIRCGARLARPGEFSE